MVSKNTGEDTPLLAKGSGRILEAGDGSGEMGGEGGGEGVDAQSESFLGAILSQPKRLDAKRKMLMRRDTILITEDKMKLVRYCPEKLTGFHAFSYLGGSIFASKKVWRVMLYLILLSFLVGIIVFFAVDRPQHLNLNRFKDMASFLKVFIAFMLGMYVTSAYARFRTAVQGVLELFNSIRNCQTQLGALGVPEENRTLVRRYGVTSCHILAKELQYGNESVPLWEWKALFSGFEEEGKLSFDERLRLEEAVGRCDEMCNALWMWVASYIGWLAESKIIPPMASPTYGRIMQIAVQDAQEGIRKVKESVTIQMPFTYTHMLSILVHCNNLLLSMMTGVSIGSALGQIVIAVEKKEYRDVYGPLQLIFLSILSLLIIPFFYQAFLQIGSMLCSPFSHDEFPLPVLEMIKALERNLDALDDLLAHPPTWSIPSFRNSQEREKRLTSSSSQPPPPLSSSS